MHCQSYIRSENSYCRSLMAASRGPNPIATALVWLTLIWLTRLPLCVAAEPTEKLTKALSYKPSQTDVNYEMVPADQVAQCDIDETARPDGKGFWVTGSNGQPLRWFADTNADNRLDRWCYYNSGVEVFRESDTDFNGKADEFRWLSTEGLRWGVDKDENGQIDSWKMISAEEVTAEVVRAASARDSQKFQRLLISESEIAALGVGKEKAAALKQHVVDAAKQFEDWVAGQNVVTSRSKWTNFGADKPGIVPSGTDGSSKDIVVYENVVALLEDNGNTKQLLVGTMIQVGSSWRLVDLPRAVSEGAVVSDASIFFPASFSPRGNSATSGEAAGGISKQMAGLVTELQDVDSKLQAATGNPAQLQAMRADVLEKLVSESTTADERTTWIKQFADTVSAAAQTGDYPSGSLRLNEFANKLSTVDTTPDDVAYVVFRALTADHNHKMMTATEAEYEPLQKEYLDNLQGFVDKYPTSGDSAEAMIQIALSAEFSGENKTAEQWYTKARAEFKDTVAGRKAAGALTRLNLVGKSFGFSSPTLENKPFSSADCLGGPVVYHCWASWCEGCKAEMRALNELRSKYAKTKLKIVGLNFDNEPAIAKEFLKQNRYDWAHIHDAGGLESNLAISYGILTLPFNVVVDKQGKVVKTGVHWTELDGVIEAMVK